MAQHRHLFVMDPVENLNLKLDSSLRLAQALLRSGHECFTTTLAGLSRSVVNGNQIVEVAATRLEASTADTPAIGKSEKISGDSLHAVHMRKDPPFDMDYLSSTWTLSALEKWATIYNKPQTLRDRNEKLIIFDYPDYIQPALVSSDVEMILDFIEQHCAGDAIIKPLDLFGGRGVERVEIAAQGRPTASKRLEEATAGGRHQRIVQPFDKAIHDGEVRVFTAGSEIISWCLKVPKKGEFLANTRAGAEVLAYSPSPAEEEMVRRVSQDLETKGVFFVGYDLIGGHISEINITSPRLLLPESEDSRPCYQKIAELVTRDLR